MNALRKESGQVQACREDMQRAPYPNLNPITRLADGIISKEALRAKFDKYRGPRGLSAVIHKNRSSSGISRTRV